VFAFGGGYLISDLMNDLNNEITKKKKKSQAELLILFQCKLEQKTRRKEKLQKATNIILLIHI
jgi:hypothetical protein